MSHALLSLETANKPNRVDETNKNNNEDYHAQYARWAVGDAYNHLHTDFIRRTQLNKKFYKGDQWIYDEDVEAFLKDDTGQDANRIKVVHNIIRPMVEHYRGNAIRMVINARVKAISKKAVTRREKALEKQLFMTEVAQEAAPILGDAVRETTGVGRTKGETQTIFQNRYVDEYVKSMNRLLQYSAELNEFAREQIRVAFSLAMSGLTVLEGFEHGGHLRSELVESEEFIFDRSARKPDLSDAAYQGKVPMMLPTQIFERWQDIKHVDRQAIEEYVVSMQKTGYEHYGETTNLLSATRVPVYHVYWRDIDTFTYAYVMDDYGYPYLTKINFVEDGDTEPKYTDADVIDPPDSARNRRLFKNGKKTRRSVVDVLRYCILIPASVIGRRSNNPSESKAKDIVLEFGLYPYQETEYTDLSNVKFPFKCQTWSYVDGDILSPMDDAINPQRLINRILSVSESHLNNSGGSGLVYDKDSVDPDDGEDTVIRNVKQGKPVGLSTKGRGIPNSISTYDQTPGAGVYKMFDIVDIMKNLTQQTTGINEPLQGQSTGNDQLVGVTQLLIQRGSLLQEPFYFAVGDVFLQMYQHVATVGKRIYIDNERELAIAIGDDGVAILKLDPDMRAEDFRAFVRRANDEEILISAADEQLRLWLQLGLIDDVTFTDMLGRSTPEEVHIALRQHTADKVEAAKANRESQVLTQDRIAQATAEQTEQARAEALDGDVRNDQRVEQGRQHELAVIDRKSTNKIAEKIIS